MQEFLKISQSSRQSDFLRFPRLHDRDLANACLVIFLITLWPLTHRYKGLAGDAALYAVQALAKIHPNLATDLFLQDRSQDNYTVFPLLYAWCIRWVGLHDAAGALLIALKIWFFAAAWALTNVLFDRRSAFVSTAMVMVVAGSYGGFSVFSYSEDWLTARTLAEPMVITAAWLFFRNLRTMAFLVGFAALLVHPLMSLPGLALLLLLSLPLSVGVAASILGVTAIWGSAAVALNHPPDLGPLSVMDAAWLETVRERSVFLFPQLWTVSDWELNALSFLSLVISNLVIRDPRIHKLSCSVALIGATGLLIAVIAADVGPVVLFLQGQAWRWVWLTRFTAVICLAPTLVQLWREKQCGPLCAVLTVLGWTFSPANGLASLAIALVLWLARHRVTEHGAKYLRWILVALAGLVTAWAVTQSWIIVSSPTRGSKLERSLILNLRNILGFVIISMSLMWPLANWVEKTANKALLACLSLVFLICCIFLYPSAFGGRAREGSAEEIAEFAAWRRLIEPDDTVLVVPAHNSATFAWFTLERPSYLTVDQSAGVVFSPVTAQEVRRRSVMLLPLMDPDWKLLSEKASARSDIGATRNEAKPLTQQALIGVCADPKLKFVVAREKLGFDPIPHTSAGNLKDWFLYDCRRVLSGTPRG